MNNILHSKQIVKPIHQIITLILANINNDTKGRKKFLTFSIDQDQSKQTQNLKYCEIGFVPIVYYKRVAFSPLNINTIFEQVNFLYFVHFPLRKASF
jgi:hypothetical protein